jgi:TIR domain
MPASGSGTLPNGSRPMASHVNLDQWDVQCGESLTQFMKEKIPESDFVLIICTPAYAVKSTQRQGGVGYEAHFSLSSS